MTERARQRGFTLLELTMVMAVLAIAVVTVGANIDGLIPGKALQASARDIGTIIEMARGNAASRGRIYAIRYDLEAGTYQLFGPPPREDEEADPEGRNGPGPWGLYPGIRKSLKRGVRFAGIQPMGLDLQQGGELAVRFDPLAIEGSHIVYLENDDGQLYSVKYNALTGLADYIRGEAVFEGSDG
jgi:prepilin-type N-terminal cleavage/methylation domain-containing protein